MGQDKNKIVWLEKAGFEARYEERSDVPDLWGERVPGLGTHYGAEAGGGHREVRVVWRKI